MDWTPRSTPDCDPFREKIYPLGKTLCCQTRYIGVLLINGSGIIFSINNNNSNHKHTSTEKQTTAKSIH